MLRSCGSSPRRSCTGGRLSWIRRAWPILGAQARTESMRPRCSIVVRAFNEEQHIGKLLTGISQQSLKELEVIVVDSGSTDATVAIASHYPTPLLSIAPEAFTFSR